MADWLTKLADGSDVEEEEDDDDMTGLEALRSFVVTPPKPALIGAPSHSGLTVYDEAKMETGVNITISSELLSMGYGTLTPSTSTSSTPTTTVTSNGSSTACTPVISSLPPYMPKLPGFVLHTHNVVAAAQVPCRVDCREFVMFSGNCITRTGKSVVEKHMRNPGAHLKVYTSGKMTAYGCATPQVAYIVLRRMARVVQHLMYAQRFAHAADVQMRNYRVCNVMGSTRLPFGINLEALHETQKPITDYEPELATGLIWRVRGVNADGSELRATLRIQHTGSVVVTGATSCYNARAAICHVLDILSRFAVNKQQSLAELKRQTLLDQSMNATVAAHRRKLLQETVVRLGTNIIPAKVMNDVDAQTREFRRREEHDADPSQMSDERRAKEEGFDSLDHIMASRKKHRLKNAADPDFTPSIARRHEYRHKVQSSAVSRKRRATTRPTTEDKSAKRLPTVRMIDERTVSSDEDDDFEEVL